jgi:hypothetical protein
LSWSVAGVDFAASVFASVAAGFTGSLGTTTGAAFAAANSFCSLSLSTITSESFASKLLTLASESCNFVSALGEAGAVAVAFSEVKLETSGRCRSCSSRICNRLILF